MLTKPEMNRQRRSVAFIYGALASASIQAIGGRERMRLREWCWCRAVQDKQRETGIASRERDVPAAQVKRRPSAPRLRKTINKLQRAIDRLQKFAAEISTPLLVPQGCLIQFIGGFGFRSKPVFHRFFKRWIVRSRTSSHTSPADSPARTRRARRSISRAQAA